MGEPVPGEIGVQEIPACIPRSREAITNLGELVDLNRIPVLLELLQRKMPEVPEPRHVKAGIRPVPPALHQGPSHFDGKFSPLPLLRRRLYFSGTPVPQVIAEAARGTTLVLQAKELLALQRPSVAGEPQGAELAEPDPNGSALRVLLLPLRLPIAEGRMG